MSGEKRSREKRSGDQRDLEADGQEVDPVRLLDEAHAIQDELRRYSDEELKADYANLYEKARETARKRHKTARYGAPTADEAPATTPPADDADPDVHRRALQEVLAVFGAEASGIARQAAADRLVITFLCPDQKGVVATAARAISDRGGSIVRSSMSLIADHTVTSFLVGLPSGLEADEVERGSHDVLGGRAGTVPIVLPARAIEIGAAPRRAIRLVVSVRTRRPKSVVLSVSGAIKELGALVLQLNYAREAHSGLQTFDASVAAPVDDTLEPPSIRCRQFEQMLQRQLGDIAVSVRLAPVWENDTPSPHRPSRGEQDVFAIVAARGRRGFVHTVAACLAAPLADPEAVRAVHVLVLQGICIVTALLDASGVSRGGKSLEELFHERLQGAWEQAGWEDPFTIRVWEPLEAPGEEEFDLPTHELTLAVPQRSGVIADIGKELMLFDVNIYWLSSGVLPPIFGESGPRFLVVMQLEVPPQNERALDAHLQSVSRASGWQNVSFRPWSLSGDRPWPSAQLQEEVDRRLAALRPRMSEFDGHVGVDVTRQRDDPPSVASWSIRVVIGPEAPGTANDHPLTMRGLEADAVPFDVRVSSDSLTVEPASWSLTVAGAQPAEVEFRAQGLLANHRANVFVRHANRTVQIVPLALTPGPPLPLAA